MAKCLRAIGCLLLLVMLLVTPTMAAPVVKPQVESAPSKLTTPSSMPAVPTRPDVIVKSIRLIPAQPKAGEFFEVQIELFNRGKLPTGPEQKFIVEIKPGVFTPDPDPVPGRIAANQSQVIIKKYTLEAAGNYEVWVRPIPGPSDATVQGFTVAKLAKVHPGEIKAFDPQPEPPGKEGKLPQPVQAR